MQTIQNKKVRDAVNNIIQNHAFYATILMQQNIKEDNSAKNPTFYVDGKNLGYNSKFADSLTFDEVKGVLAHEIMHLVLLHHARMGKRDPHIYNIAADHVINNQLIKDGFVLPKGLYNDPKFAGMNVEQVYRILYLEQIKKQAEQDKKNREKQENNSDSSDSMAGAGDNDEDSDSDNNESEDSKNSENSDNQEDVEENDSGSDSDNSDEGDEENSDSSDNNGGDEEKEVGSDDNEGEGEENKPVTFGEIRPALDDNAEETAKIQSKQAIAIAKVAGEMPGNSIIEMIENSYKPKFNWREIINQFVSEITQKDYSFENPDRRFLQNGIILPDFYSKAPANIVVAIDTSGSVNLDEVRAMVEETRHCLDIMSEDKENATLTVLYFDHMIQGVEVFESGSDIKPNPKGGGGTAYSPIFKYIQDNDIKCDGLICVTDGYCDDFGPIIPEYKTFWGITVVYNDFRPPFGEKFVFDIHE